MANYAPSTRSRIADLIIGMHVKTTDGVLGIPAFTNAAQTEMFTIVGRIAIRQLFVELTAVADANLTTVAFNATFTVPAIGVNEIQADCTSIAALPAGQRIVCTNDVVATALILTDSAGTTDVDTGGRTMILGGESAAGVNYEGTIGMLTAAATQAGVITATGHIFYYPMSEGAYVESLI
jgi:hypothetical protein